MVDSDNGVNYKKTNQFFIGEKKTKKLQNNRLHRMTIHPSLGGYKKKKGIDVEIESPEVGG